MYPVSAAATAGLLPGGRPGRAEGEVDRGTGQEEGGGEQAVYHGKGGISMHRYIEQDVPGVY